MGWWEEYWADDNYRSMSPEEWRRASAYHFICLRCGVEVWDKKAHDEFHNSL